ncbi:MAG: hypothetical protein MUD09_00550 [Desulfobacterales bacterium]|nr:hypothetical protein [Desulfobacterales bacterium]
MLFASVQLLISVQTADQLTFTHQQAPNHLLNNFLSLVVIKALLPAIPGEQPEWLPIRASPVMVLAASVVAVPWIAPLIDSRDQFEILL